MTIQRTTALSFWLWPLDISGSKSLGNISRHLREKVVTGSSQLPFIKVKSCLTNMTAFYNKTAIFADKRRAVDLIYIKFRKAFDTVFHFWGPLYLELSCDPMKQEIPLQRDCWVSEHGAWTHLSVWGFSFLLDCNKEASDDSSHKTVLDVPHLNTWSQSPGCYEASMCKDYSFAAFHNTVFV